MKLPKFAFITKHAIWQPRWRDMTVLIAKHTVGEHNVIEFSKLPEGRSWHGEWYVSGETIRKYPLESMNTKRGGKVMVYAVPLDELVTYEGKKDAGANEVH